MAGTLSWRDVVMPRVCVCTLYCKSSFRKRNHLVVAVCVFHTVANNHRFQKLRRAHGGRALGAGGVAFAARIPGCGANCRGHQKRFARSRLDQGNSNQDDAHVRADRLHSASKRGCWQVCRGERVGRVRSVKVEQQARSAVHFHFRFSFSSTC